MLKPIFEAFVERVLQEGEFTETDYPYCLTLGYRTSSGIEPWSVSTSCLIQIFLYNHEADDFNFEECRRFCERLREISRWSEIKYTLDKWFERTLKAPFIAPASLPFNGYRVRTDVDISAVNPEWLALACYIAVCHSKYGASWNYLKRDEIFDVVTALGSDLPCKLKKHGSGELPRAVTHYMDNEVNFKANDAFATIKIVIGVEREDNYKNILDCLIRLLRSGFPGSYAIEFRSPNKAFLPVKGLPKKGVNQLFANAVKYQSLWPLIEEYARLAMREFEDIQICRRKTQ